MKKSNLFILIGALIILGFFIKNNLGARYIPIALYEQNTIESIISLDQETFTYTTQRLAQNFDEIRIIDPKPKSEWISSNGLNTIRWVPSNESGMKVDNNLLNNAFRFEIDGKTLTIYAANTDRGTANIIFYSPSLKKLSLDNAVNFRMINTNADSLALNLNEANLRIDDSNGFQKIHVRGEMNSTASLAMMDTEQAIYELTLNSTIDSQLDSCTQLFIVGDASSQVRFSMDPERSDTTRIPRPYGSVRFNDEIGRVAVDVTTKIDQLIGDKNRLNLNMPVPAIEKLLQRTQRE